MLVRVVACRVRIRLRVGNRVFEGKALLNSDFESDAPDIIVPVYIARELGLWPPRTKTVTAIEDRRRGGVVAILYLLRCARAGAS
jgi:hypothetical protein